MSIRHFIFLPLAAVFASCSPESESGLTKQEIQDITALVMRQTTNHVVGLQRESSGDITWTAPLQAGTNAVGITYTVRQQPSGWAIVSQKPERLHD
jgi:hypothetical protein